MREALLISSGNGPGECRQAVGHFLAWLAAEAEILGLDLDVTERAGVHGPTSAVVVLSGIGAGDLARSLEGAILWRCPSSLRPGHLRKNWFIEVFRLAPSPGGLRIDPATVEMQAIRAGGPGGQHQNKTSSAIRARWTDPAGKVWSVVVRDTRSQHQNRSLALERLAALVAADGEEVKASRKGAARALHQGLARGAPRRVFEGPAFRAVG
ncbi:MAG: peptide chain release factor-like protein [Tabrizicola sp.]|jgi:peptide chain release factor|nr:peptide chain release factor-like protein [Tabrizicola sp.]